MNAAEVKFEIGNVLFIDIVDYSKLLINEQSDQIQKLKGGQDAGKFFTGSGGYRRSTSYRALVENSEHSFLQLNHER